MIPTGDIILEIEVRYASIADQNQDLRRCDVPLASSDWNSIGEIALTFNGYDEHGSLEACAAIASQHRSATLSDLRTCLFFEQRRWRHYGEAPHGRADDYLRSLVQRIRDVLPE